MGQYHATHSFVKGSAPTEYDSDLLFGHKPNTIGRPEPPAYSSEQLDTWQPAGVCCAESAGPVGAAMTVTSVFSGQNCIGFILDRGEAGFEAFSADEQSLGLFPTQHEAAAAIMRGAP